MSDSHFHNQPSDEALIAFLDGKLSGEDEQAIIDLIGKNDAFAVRLVTIDCGRLNLEEAFAPLLEEAPLERMAAHFEAATNNRVQKTQFSRRGFMAAAFALVSIGAVAGGGLGTLLTNHNAAETRNWRNVVANYMELYSTETLTNMPAYSMHVQDEQIANVGRTIGLPLNLADINMPFLTFKRAQLLQFKGKPLAQFAYLDDNRQPFALCVFAGSAGIEPPRTEERYGMNIVFWANDDLSFLVIGHLPSDKMQSLAKGLIKGLPA